jgi:hypothetical protein
MKTIQEQIAVMQHFADGGKVETHPYGSRSQVPPYGAAPPDVEALRSHCADLAATACVVEGGLVAHDNGSPVCTLQKQITKLQEKLAAAQSVPDEYRRLLKMIAYPRRGQMEETMTLQDFADAIQEKLPLWMLEGEEGNV